MHPGSVQGGQDIRCGFAGTVVEGQADPLFRQGFFGGRTGACLGKGSGSGGEGGRVRHGGQVLRAAADKFWLCPGGEACNESKQQGGQEQGPVAPKTMCGELHSENLPCTLFCGENVIYIDMTGGKIYEKPEKSLTVREECGNIFKQSARRPQASEIGWTAENRICEGGGTGRRARLRCVWFILGGSSPLPRTIDQYTSCAGFSFAMRENAGPAAAEGPQFLLLQSRRGLHRDQEHGTLCLCTMVYERL